MITPIEPNQRTDIEAENNTDHMPDNILAQQISTLLGAKSCQYNPATEILVVFTYRGETIELPIREILTQPIINEELKVIRGESKKIPLERISNHVLRLIAKEFNIDPHTQFERIKRMRNCSEEYENAQLAKAYDREQRNKRVARNKKYARRSKKFYNRQFEQ